MQVRICSVHVRPICTQYAHIFLSYRSHIANKVPQLFQNFCVKIAQLASNDPSKDCGSLHTSFQRIFQKKQEGGKKKKEDGGNAHKMRTEKESAETKKQLKESKACGSKTSGDGHKKGASGVGPLTIDPPSSQPAKKLKQTVSAHFLLLAKYGLTSNSK